MGLETAAYVALEATQFLARIAADHHGDPTGGHSGNNTGGDHHGGGDHGGGHGDDHGGHGDHMHAYVPILFPVVALIMGAATMQFLSRCFPTVPYTIVVLFEGLIMGELVKYGHDTFIDLKFEPLVLVDQSFNAWIHIDAHLLLYAFLPALLFGDSMGLNWVLIKKCLAQSATLAGPGVLLGAFLGMLAVVAMPYGLPIEVGFLIATILAATDPVAVVGILKEMGMRPKLTMIIAGESLMNDGVAIVLYLFFRFLVMLRFEVLRFYYADDIADNGVPTSGNFGDLIIFGIRFFLKVGFGGFVYGLVSGFVFLFWISTANLKTNHSDSMVQLSATLGCAYWTFYSGEAMLGVSGVLATVTAAVVVGAFGWPYFADKEFMGSCWHIFEFLFNTVLFFLSGAIVGGTSTNLDIWDFALLIYMYIAAHVVRFCVVWLFFPILSGMGYGVSKSEAAVMVFGGLRGAIGLALAIDTKHWMTAPCHEGIATDSAQCAQLEEIATKAFFHIGGFAVLTLAINGTMFRAFLGWMGFMDGDASKDVLLHGVEATIAKECHNKYVSATRKFHEDDLAVMKDMIVSRCHILQEYEHMRERMENSKPPPAKKGKSFHQTLTESAEPTIAVQILFFRILRQEVLHHMEIGLLTPDASMSTIFIEAIDRRLNRLDSTGEQDATNTLEWIQLQFSEHRRYTSILKCLSCVTPASWDWRNKYVDRSLNIVGVMENKKQLCWLLMVYVEAMRKAQNSLAQILVNEGAGDMVNNLSLLKETSKLIKSAKEVLASYEPAVIMQVLTNQVVVVIHEEQRRLIVQFQKSGMLEATDAHEMLHHLEEEKGSLWTVEQFQDMQKVVEAPTPSGTATANSGSAAPSGASTNLGDVELAGREGPRTSIRKKKRRSTAQIVKFAEETLPLGNSVQDIVEGKTEEKRKSLRKGMDDDDTDYYALGAKSVENATWGHVARYARSLQHMQVSDDDSTEEV